MLILGERGTGKELAAERLHYLSRRWDEELLKVNCAAMVDSLLESELFGHEPGAFTGASRSHQGRFERADGGTLFLDELATMSLRLQEKILRVIEYGTFERLGSQQTRQTDVRIVAATNADLPSMAAAGTFRADLLDRLSFDVVHLPALRHRREDIEELAQHFAVQMAAELGWTLFPGFSQHALDTLMQHDWPGNIRELKNTVERSVYRWARPAEALDEIIIDPFQSPFSQPLLELETAADAEQPVEAPERFVDLMERTERQALASALARHGHHQGRTAQALGLTYDQLRGMVRKHGLSKRKRRSKGSG